MESRTFAPRSLPDGRGGFLQLMVVAGSGSSAPNRSRRLRPWVIGRAYGIGGEGSCRGWCGKPLPGAHGVRGVTASRFWTASPLEGGSSHASARRPARGGGRQRGPRPSCRGPVSRTLCQRNAFAWRGLRSLRLTPTAPAYCFLNIFTRAGDLTCPESAPFGQSARSPFSLASASLAAGRAQRSVT